jgi:hypothetical protein
LQRVQKSGCCRLAADNVELMSSPSPDIIVRTNERRANLCRDERGNEPSQPYGPVLHRPLLILWAGIGELQKLLVIFRFAIYRRYDATKTETLKL